MRIRAQRVIGRDRELGLLRSVLDDARRGHGRVVFLVGEGGIGKSRLAAETVVLADGDGMRVLQGRGSVIGPMIPFRPLTEALLSLFRSGAPPDDPGLDPYRPTLGRLVPHWAAPASEQQPGSLVVLAEAILRLTAVVGREHGCLLVLEDLQDADPETLAVVEYLVDNISRQPTALLATLRTDPGDALDLVWRAEQRDAGTVLELGRLGRGDVHRLVDACLDADHDEVPAAVGELLWDTSAGVPFVVEELLHGMLTSGLLAPGADGWRTVGDVRVEVPVTLARSIAARADRLGEQGRAVLSVAAVLGRRFPLEVVQAVSGLDDRSLLSHVHAGVAAQLLAHDELTTGWYSFQHPLTAEALLGQLTPTDRTTISAQVADALERLYPGLPGPWCQQTAVLRLDAGDRAGAAALFAEAGRRALAEGAADSAAG
ncbi:MAG TPA: AAA family ATPase, partial [Pseudonocardiaceae bacterium]